MTDIRTYVLDTSVLLSDPWACSRFAEHEVVVPLVVISELEAKRHHHELGWFARQALRLFDDLRLEHGRLDQPIPVGTQGGTLHVELNHTDPAVLPAGFRTDSNDSRILSCAANLAAEGKRVTLVSKDIPLRVKAAAVGLAADEYHAQDVVVSGWTGMTRSRPPPRTSTRCSPTARSTWPKRETCPATPGFGCWAAARMRSAGSPPPNASSWFAATARSSGCAAAPPSSGWRWICCSTSRWASCRWAARPAPASRRWRCAPGLEAVLERRTQRKVVVFRPLYAVGGQELGYLPGSESEKMGPWAQAVFDTLEGLASPAVLEEVLSRGMLEVLPLTHIRGRSLHDSFVIVDEAQSLERNVLLTVLSRLGTGSRVVLTHDIAQRDNLRVGRHDGVAAVIEKLKGHPLFAHITLLRSERSPIAALVTEMLEEIAGPH